ncbi:MAG: dockerin type I repeat-containing protein [Candidatus Zixiibacteriota bacterium]
MRSEIPVKFEIRMFNDDGFTRQNVSIPLTFYIIGSDYNFYPVNVGGYSSNGSIELMNGFEPDGFWDLGSGLTEFDCDGIQPEGICYNGTASTGSGWSSGLGIQTYITFNFRFSQPYGNEILFCIDSAGYGGDYDWLFEEPSPAFQGPYCYTVMYWYPQPPVFTNCPPVPLVSNYANGFQYDFNAYSPDYGINDFNMVTGPGTINSANGVWTFNTDISEAGDVYIVTVGVADAGHPNEYDTCSFTVNIASAAGDVNGDMKVNILDVVALISYLYRDGARPAHFYHANVDADWTLNLLDVIQLLNYLYKGGSIIERNIKDDYALRKGSYWKYERFRRDENITDTVTVTVTDYGMLRYQYPDTTIFRQFDIINEMIYIGSYTPFEFVYDMPVTVGEKWIVQDTGYYMIDSVALIQALYDLPVGYIEDNYKIIRKLSAEQLAPVDLYREEWFAPGYGMVRLHIWNGEPIDDYDESWDLIQYGPVSVKSAAGD